MDERRHEPRVKALTLVDVAEFNEAGLLTELTMGRTLDVSQDGMRLELNHPVPVDSTLTLELELGESVVEVHGKVHSCNRVTANGQTRYAMGVEFLDLSTENFDKLQAYVQLHGE